MSKWERLAILKGGWLAASAYGAGGWEVGGGWEWAGVEEWRRIFVPVENSEQTQAATQEWALCKGLKIH